MPLERVTDSFWLLSTLVLRALPLTMTSEAETNWLPLTVSTAPCSTCEKVMVFGESEPMSGTGLALPERVQRVIATWKKQHREERGEGQTGHGNAPFLDGRISRLDRECYGDGTTPEQG
jgi:hypothetical protein